MNQKRLCELARELSVTTTQDFSVALAKADGSFVWDYNGKKYHDFHSSVGTANFGHNHPRILWPLMNFFNENGIFHIGCNEYVHEWAAKLMTRLCAITPGNFEKKVFLCNSGTESVEAALKIMMDYHLRNNPRKNIYLAFKGGFHGRTLGALAFNASKEVHRRGFPGFASTDVIHIPFPEIGSSKDPILELAKLAKKVPLRRIGGIIFELVQGEGGINVADVGRMRALVNFLREHGALICVDEVQTGMYRTGTLFACEQYGIEPDIICLGKSLGGGLPIGATVIRKELDFKERGRHSNTFGGNPLVCVAASAAIEVARSLNEDELKKKIDILAEFAPEGLGMMRRKRFNAVEERDAYIERAKQRGVLLIGAGEKNVRFMPPVNISEKNLRNAINILKKIPD